MGESVFVILYIYEWEDGNVGECVEVSSTKEMAETIYQGYVSLAMENVLDERLVERGEGYFCYADDANFAMTYIKEKKVL